MNTEIIKHLLEGAEEAIKTGPSNKAFTHEYCREWDKMYTTSLYSRLDHYKNGGTITNLPGRSISDIATL